MAIVINLPNSSIGLEPTIPTGFMDVGCAGVVGKEGEDGTGIYFIDYNPDNDFAYNSTLEKIDEDSLLSTDKQGIQTKRSYKENDIILTTKGDLYVIKPSVGGNNKYSLEKIGKIKNKEYEQDPLLDLYNSIRGVQVKIEDSSLCDVISVPNKSIECSSYDTRTNTKECIMPVSANVILSDNLDDLSERYDLTLRIRIRNQKNYIGGNTVLNRPDQGERTVGTSTTPTMTFYKTIDIPATMTDGRTGNENKINLPESILDKFIFNNGYSSLFKDASTRSVSYKTRLYTDGTR